ncbi:MAG TPA: proton-conducting transporter membrane subunit [Terracidiphilus sp.]|nr:proton-conducting transporter membrane subunit [Terracidiphilus sp.]
MNAPSFLTPLPVAVPLVGAALMACLRKWLSRAAADSIGILFSGATLAISSLLLLRAIHGPSVYWLGYWFPRGSMALGIGLVAEPIGAGLAVLAATLTFLALVFSWRLVNSGSNHFQPLMLIFLAAMSGFSLTVDIFNLFVFFELMSTAAFALCGLKTEEPAPLQGSFNFAVTNTIAAFLILTGVGLLYAVTGALNMAQIGLALGSRHDPLILFAFTLLICGFFIKAAIVPFHLWLPDAHAVAPTPVCVLFSGLMVQLGLFAVARLRFLVFGQTFAHHESQLRAILIALGTLTVIIGGLMCYAEHHLKRMLAFSTISHSGIMLLALAMGTPLGFAAMMTYLIAHAFIKSSLFFCCGILLHRLRAVGERTLFAKGKTLHWTAGVWFLGAFGLAAAPPFLTMMGEAGISKAAEDLGLSWLSWVCFFGGVFTSAAVLRVGMHTFLGWGTEPITDEAAEIGELPETPGEDQRIFWYQYVPAAVMIAVPIFLVAEPRWLAVLRDASAAFTQQSAMLHLVYTGTSVEAHLPAWTEALLSSSIRGIGAFVVAGCLACTSVFRLKLRRWFRVGAFLESGIRPLRAMQSGHPGDYVLWLTIGLACVSGAAMVWLRSAV